MDPVIKADPVKYFPDEIWPQILGDISPERLALISLVCKSWNIFFSHNDVLWKNLALNYFRNDTFLQSAENESWKELFKKKCYANKEYCPRQRNRCNIFLDISVHFSYEKKRQSINIKSFL